MSTTTLIEGKARFVFAEAVQATPYDQWPGYTNRIQSFAESKAVDFLAIAPRSHTLYLIEVKDYRLATKEHSPPSELPAIMAQKCRDTLAGLVLATRGNNETEADFAALALKQRDLVAILHMDQPKLRFRTRPEPFNVGDLGIALKRAFGKTVIKVRIASTSEASQSLPYEASFV